jgi:hypothetical protein
VHGYTDYNKFAVWVAGGMDTEPGQPQFFSSTRLTAKHQKAWGPGYPLPKWGKSNYEIMQQFRVTFDHNLVFYISETRDMAPNEYLDAAKFYLGNKSPDAWVFSVEYRLALIKAYRDARGSGVPPSAYFLLVCYMLLRSYTYMAVGFQCQGLREISYWDMIISPSADKYPPGLLEAEMDTLAKADALKFDIWKQEAFRKRDGKRAWNIKQTTTDAGGLPPDTTLKKGALFYQLKKTIDELVRKRLVDGMMPERGHNYMATYNQHYSWMVALLDDFVDFVRFQDQTVPATEKEKAVTVPARLNGGNAGPRTAPLPRKARLPTPFRQNRSPARPRAITRCSVVDKTFEDWEMSRKRP